MLRTFPVDLNRACVSGSTRKDPTISGRHRVTFGVVWCTGSVIYSRRGPEQFRDVSPFFFLHNSLHAEKRSSRKGWRGREGDSSCYREPHECTRCVASLPWEWVNYFIRTTAYKTAAGNYLVYKQMTRKWSYIRSVLTVKLHRRILQFFKLIKLIINKHFEYVKPSKKIIFIIV